MKTILLLFCVFGLIRIQAQETVNASGGDASGSGGSSSYSVGQVTYTTHVGINGSLSQGVQQPYEISVVTGQEESNGINLSVSAFPNPTSDYLILEVNDFPLSTLTFSLYDTNGKLLETKKLEGIQTKIVMSNLVPATYFVKIIEENKVAKTFKVIKN
ncbi:MAG: T9SS type A sorting domain-containing protein [Bacteroidales bacterium]|nr:T9SS type A sorting domain-containing protein [Bacteroidales bacterium]